MEREKTLRSELNITKFAQNQEKFYSLDSSQDWVRELLLELNENADDETPEDYLKQTDIQLALDISKKFDAREGEKLLVRGRVTADYITRCVRSLEIMKDSVDIEIRSCFLDSSLQDNDMYVDQTETFQENEMYDLYFYDNKQVKLAEMVHEQIFLNYNQYPVADPEAELSWVKPTPEKKQ